MAAPVTRWGGGLHGWAALAPAKQRRGTTSVGAAPCQMLVPERSAGRWPGRGRGGAPVCPWSGGRVPVAEWGSELGIIDARPAQKYARPAK